MRYTPFLDQDTGSVEVSGSIQQILFDFSSNVGGTQGLVATVALLALSLEFQLVR
jgi:hypothetical protein